MASESGLSASLPLWRRLSPLASRWASVPVARGQQGFFCPPGEVNTSPATAAQPEQEALGRPHRDGLGCPGTWS